MEIRHRFSNTVIFSADVDTVKELVRAAIEKGTDLSWANLSRADLTEANLEGANLDNFDLPHQPEETRGFVASDDEGALPVEATRTFTHSLEN